MGAEWDQAQFSGTFASGYKALILIKKVLYGPFVSSVEPRDRESRFVCFAMKASDGR